jgi:hypothetical protein
MADVVVSHIMRVPSRDKDRAGKFDRFVFYRPAEGGAMQMVTIPDETFTEAAVKAAIKKDLDQHSALKGKTLSV